MKKNIKSVLLLTVFITAFCYWLVTNKPDQACAQQSVGGPCEKLLTLEDLVAGTGLCVKYEPGTAHSSTRPYYWYNSAECDTTADEIGYGFWDRHRDEMQCIRARFEVCNP